MMKELSPDSLKKKINPDDLGIDSTKEIDELSGIVGQQRAVEALKFGLEIEGCGYNIYVAGPPGIGKMTSVKSFLEELAGQKKTPDDWCYINNFHDPYHPKALTLPAGRGNQLKKDMDTLVEHLKKELPKAFESEEYNNEKESIIKSLQNDQNSLSKELNEKASEKGFNIQSTPMGIAFVPLKDNKPMSDKEMNSLSSEEREELEKKQAELQDDVKAMMKKLRNSEKKIQEEIRDLDKKIALHLVDGFIDDLNEKYNDFPAVKEYFDEVKKDIIDNTDTFKPSPSPNGSAVMPGGGMQNMEAKKEIALQKYKVNVVIDNSKQVGAPVIVEFNPTSNNLLGRIEKEMKMGALSTDFSMVKAGSLLRANGGYLVVEIEDLLKDLFAYDGLKRALRSSELQIEEPADRYGFLATKSLRPSPIPLNVKVILVGSSIYYHLLHARDSEFPELFKVKADYDTQMSFADENIQNFIRFVATYCKNEKLLHLDKTAISVLVEHSLRMASDQEKLSTEFGHIADLIREANYWAKSDGSSKINKKHVQKALDQRVYRSGLIQDKIKEMIDRGTLLIDVEGKEVGQVNGLSVLSTGDYQFGRPSRITATVAPGKEGIIDIEREVKLGGPIHSKGMLILSGYLSKKFAGGKPLTLAARVVFEQSYSGIEGDSASAAELFTIISALSEIPIIQGIAVTGSVNQHGKIQPIGGVNEKIEGYFDVCKAKGLTGDQGVIIPNSNVNNLMLKDEVIEAVHKGQFHVWSMDTIDEGIEILTGKIAGSKNSSGKYPDGSINYTVTQKLNEYSERMLETYSLQSNNN